MKVKKRPKKSNSWARLKKINHSLYLEPWQSEQLAEISAKTGVPQQVFLRMGLMLVFEQWNIGSPDLFNVLIGRASKALPETENISDVVEPEPKASQHK